jgi:hypothetical protein
MNRTFDGVYKIAKKVRGEAMFFVVILFYNFILFVKPKFFQCKESLEYKESPVFRAEVQNCWSSTFMVSILFKLNIEFPL